jgi:hypothetical protein
MGQGGEDHITTMKGTNFASIVRYRTKTNSTTLTDAEIVLLANVAKDALAEEIVTECGEGYFDMLETRDLESDTRNYTFDADLLKHVRYMSAKLDGTNWVYLRETDFGMIEGQNKPLFENSHIKNLYSGRAPEFLISGSEFWVLSGDDIIAVTAGLKLVTEVYPEDITSTDLASAGDLSVPSSTTTHRLPRQTHDIWARLVSIAYKTSKEKPLPLSEDEQKIEIDRSKMYEKLRERNQVRSFVAGVPYMDGQDY